MDKQLFVVERGDNNSRYLLAMNKLDETELQNGEEVGVYKLMEIRTVKVTAELI